MRVIKLSAVEFPSRDEVDAFFGTDLLDRTPAGQFLVTSGRISEDGLSRGDWLVFTHKGELVYVARAATGREDTAGEDQQHYPHYFCIDMSTVRKASGSVIDFEHALHSGGFCRHNIARSQGWPIIHEDERTSGPLSQLLESFL